MLEKRPWSRFQAKHLQGELDISPAPLHQVLTSPASKHPSKACIKYQGRTLSYGAVDELSSRFASALTSLGVSKGDRIALFMPNIPQVVISYFGILKVGAIVVPCSPLYKERELEFQLRDSGSRVVVAANDIVRQTDLFASLEACRGRLPIRHVIAASVTDYLPPVKKRLASLAGVKNSRRHTMIKFTDLIKKSAPMSRYPTVDPLRDVAVLQYTGGTTGIAKGAMLSHHNLRSNAAVVAMAFPMKAEDTVLSVLPLFHIYGMTVTMNAPLYAGATIVLLPRFEVKEVMRTVEREGITCFHGVPTMYTAVINHPDVSRFKLASVRICVSGGAPLPLAVRKRFMELTGATLVEGYGLSEASPVTHCNPIGEGLVVKDGSIGIPIPNTDSTIVSLQDSSKMLGPNELGELAVKGPQVMLGYWNRKDETDLIMRDGWLLSGDIAKMDDDGYFYIVDRKKDLIIVSGFNVYPREVEEVLFEHPDIKEAAVIGIPDEYRGEAVKAFVVLKESGKGKVKESDITEYCRQRIASYKAPKEVEFVNELPKTLVGKVLRRRLREQTMPSR
jgi:long-chain acyl-CoA synthetase